MASPIIAEALCELDRLAEIPRFISVLAVRQSPSLLELLLGHGTTLLRADRGGEAKAVLALLVDAVVGLQGQGYSPQSRVFLEVRRRYAHCLRQLRELTRARETLDDLLRDEPDDEIRCMVLTDIGLIEAGLRRLADVIIPDAADEADILADQLARGQEFFCDAVALDSRFAGHGHLCLGVDAMLGEEWDEAVTHLEYARATMLEDPDRYSDGKLVARVSLYFGIAICNALRAERLAHAAELIRNAMLAGARIPRYLVEPTLAALSLRSEEVARDVAEALIEVEGYSALDHIGPATAARSSSIADAFLQRASEDNRGAVHRADDLRSAVPILLRVGRCPDAEDALDQLEAFALAGDGTEEFQSFLDDADNFAPVWEQEDALVARARCEESVGAYEEASQLLAQAFHRLVPK